MTTPVEEPLTEPLTEQPEQPPAPAEPERRGVGLWGATASGKSTFLSARLQRLIDMFRALKAIVILSLVTNRSLAGDWTTADGNISVAEPGIGAIRATGSRRGAFGDLGLERRNNSVGRSPSRHFREKSPKLNGPSVEKGFLEKTNGKMSASSVENRQGYDVLTMTANGEIEGNRFCITQVVVQIGNKVYKVMATEIGKDALDNPDAVAFVNSLKILAPQRARTADPAKNAQPKSLVDELSERIGGISLLTLIVCLLSHFTVGSKQRGRSSSVQIRMTKHLDSYTITPTRRTDPPFLPARSV